MEHGAGGPEPRVRIVSIWPGSLEILLTQGGQLSVVPGRPEVSLAQEQGQGSEMG